MLTPVVFILQPPSFPLSGQLLKQHLSESSASSLMCGLSAFYYMNWSHLAEYHTLVSIHMVMINTGFNTLSSNEMAYIWPTFSDMFSSLKIIIPPVSTKLKRGYTGFTSSVCPSVCGQNHVPSVSSTILAGSISYLYILSSNFRKCVACKGYCEIPKLEFLTNF